MAIATARSLRATDAAAAECFTRVVLRVTSLTTAGSLRYDEVRLSAWLSIDAKGSGMGMGEAKAIADTGAGEAMKKAQRAAA